MYSMATAAVQLAGCRGVAALAVAVVALVGFAIAGFVQLRTSQDQGRPGGRPAPAGQSLRASGGEHPRRPAARGLRRVRDEVADRVDRTDAPHCGLSRAPRSRVHRFTHRQSLEWPWGPGRWTRAARARWAGPRDGWSSGARVSAVSRSSTATLPRSTWAPPSVVSPGVHTSAAKMSSNPTTLTSSGTRSPRCARRCMTPIASRSLCATIAEAPALRAPSAAAPPWLTFGVKGPIRRALSRPVPRLPQGGPAGGRHPGVGGAGQVDELAVAERGEVGDDLPAPLDVVEHDAGEPGHLPAHEDHGTLVRDLPQVLVGQPAGGEEESVDGRPVAGSAPTPSAATPRRSRAAACTPTCGPASRRPGSARSSAGW